MFCPRGDQQIDLAKDFKPTSKSKFRGYCWDSSKSLIHAAPWETRKMSTRKVHDEHKLTN